MPSSRPELEALRIGGDAEPWRAFGFDVDRPVGGVRLEFDGGEPGLNEMVFGTPQTEDRHEHPNGVTGVDHVVLLTRDLAAKTRELVGEGFDHRPSPAPQEFFVLGPCLLEVVQAETDGLWGITFVAREVDHLPGAKDAVQPGRRIATVRREAGLGFPVALITPR